MAKPAPHPKVNLNILYPQGIPQKLPARLLKWVLTFGRYIAVLVEILVLVTFAARFKLDADLADTNEKINQQIPFIESLSTQEQQIRQTQFKLETVKTVFATSPSWEQILNKISGQTPLGVKLKTLDFDHSSSISNLQFKLSGQSSSNNDLAIFLNGLSNEPSFKDISLVNVTFQTEGLVFTITGATK